MPDMMLVKPADTSDIAPLVPVCRPEPLQYANRTRRPRLRRALFFLLVVMLVLAAVQWWQPLSYHARLHYAQYQCANHRFTPGIVVAATGGPGKEVSTPLPPCWIDFQTTSGITVAPRINRTGFGASLVFLHQRQSPAGTCRRIVAVDCYTLYLSSASVLQAMQTTVVDPADPLSLASRPSASIQEMDGGYPIGLQIDVYGGQPDPNDASRFTIDYAIEGNRGVIDGQLGDDGSVNLKIRPGSPDVMSVYQSKAAQG